MMSRQEIAQRFRALGFALLTLLFAGLVLAWIAKPPMPLGVAVAGYATGLGAPLTGLLLGEKLGRELRRRTKKWTRVLALGALATLVLSACYAIGAYVPPIIGQSESKFLFPFCCLAGLVCAALSPGSRFRPNRQLRQRTEHVIEIRFLQAANPKVLAAFRTWLHERFDAPLEGEARIIFKGSRKLRSGLSEIRRVLGEHGLAEGASIVQL